MNEEISEDTVKKIAELSQLTLKAHEVKKFQSDLDKIVKAFAVIEKFSKKITSKTNKEADLEVKEAFCSKRTRSDSPNNSISTKTFLKEAPDKEGCFVRVPAILEES